jgi:hypothetical protein
MVGTASHLLSRREAFLDVRRKEIAVTKRMFKVLSMIPIRGGGTKWTRIGTGFTNKDDSVNIYLDFIPKNFELQLREYDEDDVRKRDTPFVSGRAAPPVENPPELTSSPPF